MDCTYKYIPLYHTNVQYNIRLVYVCTPQFLCLNEFTRQVVDTLPLTFIITISTVKSSVPKTYYININKITRRR